MQYVSRDLPVLTKTLPGEASQRWAARLIGTPSFEAQGDTQEQALRRLKKEWESFLESHKPPFSKLLWAIRISRARIRREKTSWQDKKEWCWGAFWVATVPERDHWVVHFPDLSPAYFLLDAPDGLPDLLQDVIASRQEKKVLPPSCLAGNKDRLAWMKTTLPIAADPTRWIHIFPPASTSQEQDQVKEGRNELRRLGTCLNDSYPGELARSWQREEELEQLNVLLFDADHRPVVLIGPEQSGRHSLVSEVLYRYLESDPPTPARRFWQVDPNRLISGMSIVGQWEERLENIFAFLRRPSKAHQQPDLLLMDRPLSLLQLGHSSSSKLSFADVMSGWLEKGLFKLVLIATPAQWERLRERAPRFADLFLPFRLRSYALEEALPMLIQKKRSLEDRFRMTFSVQALQELTQLYRQYQQPRSLPGAMATTMDALARNYQNQELRAPEVQRWFFEQQGVARAQSFFFDQDRAYGYDEMLRQELKGQPEAVEALSQVLELIQSRCSPAGRPISTFLFVGPTGVGKTQAAKVLSRILLGTDSTPLRFDMNEYVGPQATERLLGSWNRPEGQLTSRVRYRPFGVLLLDEIEKAHPSVHDLLLQVLDEGRLTDAGGRTVYFHNLVIIMTSNLGVDRANRIPSFDQPDTEEQRLTYLREVERFFRPEFVNRIDEIVVFRRLKEEHILQIAQLQMKELLKRDGFLRRTTLLNISREAQEWVAKRGYNPKMGGRALKRQIERDLTALTAEQLLHLPTDAPVILEVVLEKDRLKPVLEPLYFAKALRRSWLPKLSAQRPGRFFNQLLQRVRAMAAELSGPDAIIQAGEGRAQWAYFHHKEKLAQLQEKLEGLLLHPAQLHQLAAMRFNLASFYKEDELLYLKDARPEELLDRMVISQLAETYRLGNPIWDQQQSGLLEAWIDLQFLEQDHRSVTEEEMDDLHLMLRSRSGDPNPAALKWLQAQYEDLFEAMDLNARWHKGKKAFHLTGFGLRPLLQPETGMHLFYSAHQSPLPVQVSLQLNGAQEIIESSSIIRLYDKRNVLTDIRSGLSSSTPLSTAEWKVLLYAGSQAV